MHCVHCADWSSECWELAETWEKVGKDLGRYVNVARFNYEKSPRLAKKLSTFSVPMIYSYVDGVRTPFLGEPSHENITVFMTKSLGQEVGGACSCGAAVGMRQAAHTLILAPLCSCLATLDRLLSSAGAAILMEMYGHTCAPGLGAYSFLPRDALLTSD